MVFLQYPSCFGTTCSICTSVILLSFLGLGCGRAYLFFLKFCYEKTLIIAECNQTKSLNAINPVKLNCFFMITYRPESTPDQYKRLYQEFIPMPLHPKDERFCTFHDIFIGGRSCLYYAEIWGKVRFLGGVVHSVDSKFIFASFQLYFESVFTFIITLNISNINNVYKEVICTYIEYTDNLLIDVIYSSHLLTRIHYPHALNCCLSDISLFVDDSS